TVHHHRIGAAGPGPTMALGVRPGARLGGGRRRHGQPDHAAVTTTPAGAAPVGRSASTRQRRHPRIANVAGGAGPDNIAQMLRKAPRGTRSVVRQAKKVTQISDQHAATLYRRTATALLRTAHRWLCLRSLLVMLRCTAKVLALLGVSEPAIGEA